MIVYTVWFFILLLTVDGVQSTAINGTSELKSLQGCSYSATCSAGGNEGVCVSKSGGCCSGGTFTSGLCPGSSDIMCCTEAACSTPWGTGTCVNQNDCNGDVFSGYCTGPSDLKCCVGGSPDPDPTPSGSSTMGVDISQPLSSSTASCFASNGVSFIVPRGYTSTGHVDSAACTSLNAAKSAGIAKRDVYLFPCPTCSSSASSQVSQLVSGISGSCGSAWSGRVWLDIEGSQYWLGNTDANRNWYQELVTACKSTASKCGVYSSASQWSAIFGSSSYSFGSDLPLWYAHYDNNPTFSDYSVFGGWSSPAVKQYKGDTTLCSFGVDLDYAPAF